MFYKIDISRYIRLSSIDTIEKSHEIGEDEGAYLIVFNDTIWEHFDQEEERDKVFEDILKALKGE